MDDICAAAPGRPPGASCMEMTELVLPNDANLLGNCLGGRVMYLIDIAAGICAHRHSRTPVVTASMDSLDFHRPIRVGEAIILKARVNYTARTSMEVEVQVSAEDLLSGERRQTSTAFLTFVSVDLAGRPVPVTPLTPETDEERRRFEEAARRRETRLKLRGHT